MDNIDETMKQMKTNMEFYFKGAAAFMEFLCTCSDGEPLVSIIPNSIFEELYVDFLKQFGEVDEPNESIKSKVIQYMKEPKITDSRNIMGCSENWYNPFYAISQTFSLEEVQAMSQFEVERLVKLGDAIGEGLY